MNTKEISLPFYEQVLDFLASGPSVQEIINYRPPSASQKRFSQLLDANRQRSLTVEENEELDHYIQIERMISLLKAKAYRLNQIDRILLRKELMADGRYPYQSGQ